jgi:hypothetical protein
MCVYFCELILIVIHHTQAEREALKEKQRNEKVKEIANALDVLSERNSNNLGARNMLTRVLFLNHFPT